MKTRLFWLQLLRLGFIRVSMMLRSFITFQDIPFYVVIELGDKGVVLHFI